MIIVTYDNPTLEYRDCYIGIDINGYDPRIPSDTKKCVYNVAYINTEQQLNQLIRKYGSTVDKDILRNWCSYETDDCIVGSKCSRVSTSICKKWFEGKTTTNIAKDGVINDYCKRFPNNDDCRCINRSKDDIYTQTKIGKDYNDGCWYVPCSTNGYLKTSDINSEKCLTNICQVIYNANKNNNVVISNNNQRIDCDFKAIKEQENNETGIIGEIAGAIESIWWIVIPTAILSTLMITVIVILLRRRSKK